MGVCEGSIIGAVKIGRGKEKCRKLKNENLCEGGFSVAREGLGGYMTEVQALALRFKAD